MNCALACKYYHSRRYFYCIEYERKIHSRPTLASWKTHACSITAQCFESFRDLVSPRYCNKKRIDMPFGQRQVFFFIIISGKKVCHFFPVCSFNCQPIYLDISLPLFHLMSRAFQLKRGVKHKNYTFVLYVKRPDRQEALLIYKPRYEEILEKSAECNSFHNPASLCKCILISTVRQLQLYLSLSYFYISFGVK